MLRLFNLINRYRALLVFLILELLCYWLLVQNNPYHSSSFFHTSNQLAGSIYSVKDGITSYVGLRKVNESLNQDNALLREQLFQRSRPIIIREELDSTKVPEKMVPYKFISAKIINNKVHYNHNHFTINKGTKDGVGKGMGVIGPNGVVGKIRTVSSNFATAYSLLHTNMHVSSIVKSNSQLCTFRWDGSDPRYGVLDFVPRHVKINKGDTVLTSGFNAVFPQNISIGTIESFELDEADAFYSIKVKLGSEFSSLSYVYIIDNPIKEEKDELEKELLTDE